jgi:TonB family protein
LAKMTRFGYVLGWKAASQPAEVQWVPGDEFEPARKAKVAAYGPLFENLPQLHVVEYQPVYYPPLARQTRTSGVVTFHVVVVADGSVSNVDLVSGHPLLVDAAKQTILKWKFLPLENSGVEFQLECNFAFSGMVLYHGFGRTFASGPQKLRIEVSESPVEPVTASMKQ